MARQAAMQAIYSLAYPGGEISGLVEHYLASYSLGKADQVYFESLVRGVCKHLVEIDQVIDPLCAQTVSNIATVELSIFALGCF